MQGTGKRLTKMGMVFGTPHYMSPEQAGGKSVDHRSDIYSLGVILYECLAGRVPFEADTSMGVLTKQMFAKAEPIERLTPDPTALGALGAIVMRCLEKEPDDRFASMDELAAALKQVVLDPLGAANDALGSSTTRHKRVQLKLREETAIPRSVPPPAEPEPRQWSRLVALAAAVVAVLALVGVSVRALFFHPGTAGSGDDPSTEPTAAPPASASPSAAATATAPTPTENPTAPPSAMSSSPNGAASASGSGASAVVPTSGTPGTSSATGTGRAQPTAHSTSPNAVVDPWGQPTKKKPKSPAVVDPWAGKK